MTIIVEEVIIIVVVHSVGVVPLVEAVLSEVAVGAPVEAVVVENFNI